MALPGKLVSGGQRGADQGGLRAAKALGIPTGGWMPRGFRTEYGAAPWLHEQYGLLELASTSYRERTIQNVKAASITILFGDFHSTGSKATLRAVRTWTKALLVNPDPEQLLHVSTTFTTETIVNIAGNRESGNPKIERYVAAVLIDGWAAYHPPAEALRLRLLHPYPVLPRLPKWEGD